MNATSAKKTGRWGVAALLAATLAACGGPEKAIEEKLEANVLFFSNFEKGVDALWAEGPRSATLDGKLTRHHLDGGVADGYVEFEPNATALSYAAKTNFAYKETGWGGAVSFWISTDVSALDADFPEPFHIGKKEGNAFPWDDAVIFVDFTKPPRSIRLGCYPNKTGEISDAMVAKHVIEVPNVSWKAGDWHHIVITWDNFNSGKADAEWGLYVDGQEMGKKSGLLMDVTWNIDEVVARFNHYKFTGQIDEIAVFPLAVMHLAHAHVMTLSKHTTVSTLRHVSKPIQLGQSLAPLLRNSPSIHARLNRLLDLLLARPRAIP